jgi:hypothetical protein
MKVLTFSRFFPKGHPKEGEPTHFVEKTEACLADILPGWEMSKTFTLHDWDPYYNCVLPKSHTIRAGNRFNAGEMASLRVWSDKPYGSKQVEFAQVEVKKVWQFSISDGNFSIDTVQIGSFILSNDDLIELAANDGLSPEDFYSWFSIHPKKKGESFEGQIISWNENINYI